MSRIPINLYDKIFYIEQNLNSTIPINLLNILASLENIVDDIIINKEISEKDVDNLYKFIDKIKEEDRDVFK